MISVVLLTVVFTSLSGEQDSTYDPWKDLNDDGIIDIYDLTMLAHIYGTSGEPLNKTALLDVFARKPEYIEYRPTRKWSRDLEPGTLTITATSEQPTPDYTWNTSLDAPTDPRIIVHLTAIRRLINVVQFRSGTSQLFMKLYLNGGQIEYVNFSGAGTRINCTESSYDAPWFGTCVWTVHLWLDAGSGADIDQVEFWFGCGCQSNGYRDFKHIVTVDIEGWAYIGCDAIGTPTASAESHCWLSAPDTWESPPPAPNYSYMITGYPAMCTLPTELKYIRQRTDMWMRGTDPTGLNSFWRFQIWLWRVPG